MPIAALRKRVAAEFVGTCFLVVAVIGSGIMAERLAGGNIALALLANTVATGAALVALILAFGGISGAHFNPAVTIADAVERGMPWREVPGYIAAQCLGGILGAAVTHLMFGLPLFSLAVHQRSGAAQVFSEFIATFGLLAVIWGCSRIRTDSIPFAVGAYIAAAYWFTSSTSFANPAVTIARALSNTFAGIRPIDAPFFITAQMCGAIAATMLMRWIIPSLPERAEDILLPHHNSDEQVKTYLFACIHNAGRSQIAAAFFNLYAGKGCRALSAGTVPAEKIHPEVIQVMNEIGIDLARAMPQLLTEELARQAHVLVTMGCGEACPFISGLRIVVWSIPDPKGQPLELVRQIRDQIHEEVKTLIKEDCADCRRVELSKS